MKLPIRTTAVNLINSLDSRWLNSAEFVSIAKTLRSGEKGAPWHRLRTTHS
jgi:hypothetical protein